MLLQTLIGKGFIRGDVDDYPNNISLTVPLELNLITGKFSSGSRHWVATGSAPPMQVNTDGGRVACFIRSTHSPYAR